MTDPVGTYPVGGVSRLALGVLVSLTMIGTAVAQTGAAPSVREACRPDYQTFCAGTSPGGGRIMACLKQHASQLSPACTAALAAHARAPH